MRYIYSSKQKSNAYLMHHGILGMKWGIRRYQNNDGSLTSAGKKRYSNYKNKEGYLTTKGGISLGRNLIKGAAYSKKASKALGKFDSDTEEYFNKYVEPNMIFDKNGNYVPKNPNDKYYKKYLRMNKKYSDDYDKYRHKEAEAIKNIANILDNKQDAIDLTKSYKAILNNNASREDYNNYQKLLFKYTDMPLDDIRNRQNIQETINQNILFNQHATDQHISAINQHMSINHPL